MPAALCVTWEYLKKIGDTTRDSGTLCDQITPCEGYKVGAGTVDGSGAIGFLLQPFLVGEKLTVYPLDRVRLDHTAGLENPCTFQESNCIPCCHFIYRYSSS